MNLLPSRVRAFGKSGVLALMSVLLVVACRGPAPDATNGYIAPNQVAGTTTDAIAQNASASLVGTELVPDISGELTLVETGTGLSIQGRLVNVPPGKHGFHIHEGSSCADEGGAAGGHFNPRQVDHGDLAAQGFENAHAGDLGNLKASPEGIAEVDIELPGLALERGDYAVAGRAFIVHVDPDDFGQPTGNAGGRIACGLIQVQ